MLWPWFVSALGPLVCLLIVTTGVGGGWWRAGACVFLFCWDTMRFPRFSQVFHLLEPTEYQLLHGAELGIFGVGHAPADGILLVECLDG